MSRLSILINSLLGVCRLSFSEEDRTAVYRAIFDARLTVLSLKNLPSGFQIDLRREDSKRLSASLKEVGVLAENVKTFGVSVVLKFLLRRSGLVFGAVLGLLLFLFCSGRVWAIELRGCGGIDPDLLLEELASCGLYEGAYIGTLDAESVTLAVLKQEKRISWMQVRREGVRVIVEAIPAKLENSISGPPEGIGANLVSAKDAVIVDLQIESGEAGVSVGSVVRKGDLLVSGVGTHSALYASGMVIGRVRDVICVTVPLSHLELSEIKTECVGYSLSLFGYVFSFGEKEAELFERDPIYLFGRIRLPAFFERRYRAAYTEREVCYTESEAAKIARRMLSARLSVLLSDGELLSGEISASYTDEGYTLTAEIEYLINIAKTLEFSLENE